MGPSEKDQLEMLKTIGFDSLDELVTSTVPANIRLEEPMELGSHTSAAMSETEALALLRSMADKNQVLKSLIGQGYHETHTPYVILRNMLENPVSESASSEHFNVSRLHLTMKWVVFRSTSGRFATVSFPRAGLVHGLHALPGRDLAGAPRDAPQLSNSSDGADGHGDG